jgi:hypothetical protein
VLISQHPLPVAGRGQGGLESIRVVSDGHGERADEHAVAIPEQYVRRAEVIDLSPIGERCSSPQHPLPVAGRGQGEGRKALHTKHFGVSTAIA